MTRYRKTGPRNTIRDIDLRLESLFGELGERLADILGSLDDIESGEIHQEKNIRTGRDDLKASAGIRIRVGGLEVDAVPRRQTSAQKTSKGTTPTSQQSAQSETPTPTVSIDATIIDEAETWCLIADLPGVTNDGLFLETRDGGLEIQANGRRKRFEGRYELPENTSVDDLQVNLHNGILEITVRKIRAGDA